MIRLGRIWIVSPALRNGHFFANRIAVIQVKNSTSFLTLDSESREFRTAATLSSRFAWSPIHSHVTSQALILRGVFKHSAFHPVSLSRYIESTTERQAFSAEAQTDANVLYHA